MFIGVVPPSLTICLCLSRWWKAVVNREKMRCHVVAGLFFSAIWLMGKSLWRPYGPRAEGGTEAGEVLFIQHYVSRKHCWYMSLKTIELEWTVSLIPLTVALTPLVSATETEGEGRGAVTTAGMGWTLNTQGSRYWIKATAKMGWLLYILKVIENIYWYAVLFQHDAMLFSPSSFCGPFRIQIQSFIDKEAFTCKNGCIGRYLFFLLSRFLWGRDWFQEADYF